jgi:hypothetical protein
MNRFLARFQGLHSGLQIGPNEALERLGTGPDDDSVLPGAGDDQALVGRLGAQGEGRIRPLRERRIGPPSERRIGPPSERRIARKHFALGVEDGQLAQVDRQRLQPAERGVWGEG